MPCLINVYKDILCDFNKEIYSNSEVLYRNIILKNGALVILSVYKSNKLSEVSFAIPGLNAQIIKKLPKWKGMEEKIMSGVTQQEDIPFLVFLQSEEYDKSIYFTVMQDLIDSINDIDPSKLIGRIKDTLEKWSVFFQFEKNYVLSDNAQQGLYGELFVLEKLIEKHGEKIVECWTGCNAETHDFYLGSDALEVKSSSAKGPDKIKISNEYQLDDDKLIGYLYLMYLKMRKSEVYGENLPDIVHRISSKLSDSVRIEFYDKLIKVGYIYQMPELYELHFIIHDETCYKVEDGFPRLTRKNLAKGIGSVDYIVSLDACEKYLITVETYYKGVTL